MQTPGNIFLQVREGGFVSRLSFLATWTVLEQVQVLIFVLQFYPKWIAPNLLTFAGFLLLVLQFVLLTFYDYSFYASSDSHPNHPPVPDFVWLVSAIFLFAAHTLGEWPRTSWDQKQKKDQVRCSKTCFLARKKRGLQERSCHILVTVFVSWQYCFVLSWFLKQRKQNKNKWQVVFWFSGFPTFWVPPASCVENVSGALM